jgi:hypothetical protein
MKLYLFIRKYKYLDKGSIGRNFMKKNSYTSKNVFLKLRAVEVNLFLPLGKIKKFVRFSAISA